MSDPKKPWPAEYNYYYPALKIKVELISSLADEMLLLTRNDTESLKTCLQLMTMNLEEIQLDLIKYSQTPRTRIHWVSAMFKALDKFAIQADRELKSIKADLKGGLFESAMTSAEIIGVLTNSILREFAAGTPPLRIPGVTSQAIVKARNFLGVAAVEFEAQIKKNGKQKTRIPHKPKPGTKYRGKRVKSTKSKTARNEIPQAFLDDDE